MEIEFSSTTRSSKMLAWTHNLLSAFEIVEYKFGYVRPCRRQRVAVHTGQLVRFRGLGSRTIPQRFDYVENGVAHFTPQTDLAGK